MAEWLGALGGFAGALGGFLNNNNSIDAQMQMLRMQQQFNAEQAKINRDWTESMRSTSYQTAMTDMKKGGLNPILAGSLGGAPTPGVAPASMGTGSVPTQQNWMAQGVASAAELMKSITSAKLMEAQAEKTVAETELTREQTPTQAVTRASLLAQIEQAKGNTRTEQERRALTQLEQNLLGAQAGAAGAAARASLGAADAATTQADKNRADLRYLGNNNAYPGNAAGWRVGPIQAPPGAQIGSIWDTISGAVGRAGSYSAESLRRLLPGTASPALNSLSDQADKVIRNIGNHLQNNQGRNPLQTPVRPHVIIKRMGPGQQYFPPMD